jgi:RimJ/RimL family protein N-acetyltransferase
MVASVTRAVLPIATERLLLRPFAADDADALHAIRSQPEVVRYLYEGPMSHAEAVEVARRRGGETALEEEGDKLSLAMELRATGELAGDLVLILTSVAHRQGEVGYTLHPGHQGRGLATEGARAILALGFGVFGLHRIAARLDGRNAASARVLERLGMRREAHLRENEWVKGEWTDELVYAMLAREWRGLVKSPI